MTLSNNVDCIKYTMLQVDHLEVLFLFEAMDVVTSFAKVCSFRESYDLALFLLTISNIIILFRT
jgi:hypothetical protein